MWTKSSFLPWLGLGLGLELGLRLGFGLDGLLLHFDSSQRLPRYNRRRVRAYVYLPCTPSQGNASLVPSLVHAEPAVKQSRSPAFAVVAVVVPPPNVKNNNKTTHTAHTRHQATTPPCRHAMPSVAVAVACRCRYRRCRCRSLALSGVARSVAVSRTLTDYAG